MRPPTNHREIGHHASGTNKTLAESAATVFFDSAIAMATANLGNKIKLARLDKAAKAIALRVSREVGFLNKAMAEKILVKYLADAGRDVFKEALTGAIKLAGNSVKSGKAPTEKEIDGYLNDLLFTALSKGVLSSWKGYSDIWSKNHSKIVTKKVAPDVLSSLKGVKLTKAQQDEVLQGIADHVSKTTLKIGHDAVIADMTGKENAKKLAAMSESAVVQSKEVRKAVKAAIEARIKKLGY